MSDFTVAFDELYSCQTQVLGVVIVATLVLGATTYGTNVAAILSGVNQNATYEAGTTAEGGGYNIKIKSSDITAEPPKGTQVTCNGSATGTTLQVTSAALVNGIYEITCGDIQFQ